MLTYWLAVSARLNLQPLKPFLRCFELPEKSAGLFSTILFYQSANARLPPWPNSGLSMLEKHWIRESRPRIFRFSEVAC